MGETPPQTGHDGVVLWEGVDPGVRTPDPLRLRGGSDISEEARIDSHHDPVLSTERIPRPVAGVIVLQSFRELRPTSNPYLHDLLDALGSSPDVRVFTWRRALLGRWHVLHVHWPERIFRRGGRARTVLGEALFALLLLRIRLRRRAVVRTVHNLEPHEPGTASERRLLAALDRRTTLWICLNDVVRPPRVGPTEVIPLGRHGTTPAPRDAVVPGRVLTFGLVRRYKGIDDLIRAVAGLPGAEVSLVVVGRPDGSEVADDLRTLAAPDPRVRLRLEHVADDELAAEIEHAELIVLPYRKQQDSSAVIHGLSAGRPVLVPANDLNRTLATEVGPGWVHLFDGDLGPADIATALEVVRSASAAAPPDLSRRAWDVIGSAHRRAYARAVELTAGGAR